ncbi:hypothetical protein [Flindersiella endophytica]
MRRSVVRWWVALFSAALLGAVLVPGSAVAGPGPGLGAARTGDPVAALGASVRAAAPACDPVDPAACLLPFPNDYFTVPSRSTATGVRVDFALSAMPRNALGLPIDPTEWNRSDGFSPGSMLLTHVPGIDLARTGAAPVTDIGRSLAADAPIVLLDARTGERAPYWAELDASDPQHRALIIRPARNLREGARYVVALRNLRSATGELLSPNPVFAALLSRTPPSDRSLLKRWAYTQRALLSLRQARVGTSGLYLAWDFTVASRQGLTRRMLSMRDQAFSALGDQAPAFTVDRVTDYTAEQNPRIARQVQGTLSVPSYLNLPLGPPGSRLLLDASGRPAHLPGNVQLAGFVCSIPRSASAAAPAKPVLYGHGLLGDPSEIDSGALQSYMLEANTMLCATPWIGMAREDIPNVIASLADVSRFPSVPDRTQQGFLNFLFLGRAAVHASGFVASPAFADASGRSLVGRDLAYLGNSQGGILGGALTAVSQDFRRAALGVPGMNYSTLLNRSVDFDQFRAVFDPAYPDRLDQQVVFALMQMVWDRGEANGYAAHMTSAPLPRTPSHRVLLIEALGDHQVANAATEVEARTVGARVRQPAVAPGRSLDVSPFWGISPVPATPYAGSALVMVDSGSPLPPPANLPPREGADPHSHPRNSPAIRAMIAHFLDTGELVDTCAGVPCTASPG